MTAIQKPPAIVLGLNPNALGTIRSLTSVGIPVIAIDAKPSSVDDTHLWMSSRTRLCAKFFLPPRASAESIIQRLLDLAPGLADDGCIIPSGDELVLAMAGRREELSAAGFRFNLPEQALLDLFADKWATYQFATRHGIPVPWTVFGVAPREIARALPQSAFPCVIKPPYRDQAWESNYPNQKAFIVTNVEQLQDQYRKIHERYPKLMVQEMIPGADSHLLFSHVYVDREGRECALWTGHKVRQLPIHVGTSTAARSQWLPRIADLTRSILRATDYRGYASLEFKLDPRTSIPKLIEVTVGRTWYPHYLGTASGVNIPHLWYRDLLEEKLEPISGFKEGVTWVDEYRDIVAAQDYRSAGELSLAGWLGSFKGVVAPALWSWGDPLPAVFVAARLALSATRSVRRKLIRLAPVSTTLHT